MQLKAERWILSNWFEYGEHMNLYDTWLSSLEYDRSIYDWFWVTIVHILRTSTYASIQMIIFIWGDCLKKIKYESVLFLLFEAMHIHLIHPFIRVLKVDGRGYLNGLMFVLIAIYTFSYVSEKEVSVIEFEYPEW